jgi:hypothetical protein
VRRVEKGFCGLSSTPLQHLPWGWSLVNQWAGVVKESSVNEPAVSLVVTRPIPQSRLFNDLVPLFIQRKHSSGRGTITRDTGFLLSILDCGFRCNSFRLPFGVVDALPEHLDEEREAVLAAASRRLR